MGLLTTTLRPFQALLQAYQTPFVVKSGKWQGRIWGKKSYVDILEINIFEGVVVVANTFEWLNQVFDWEFGVGESQICWHLAKGLFCFS